MLDKTFLMYFELLNSNMAFIFLYHPSIFRKSQFSWEIFLFLTFFCCAFECNLEFFLDMAWVDSYVF